MKRKLWHPPVELETSDAQKLFGRSVRSKKELRDAVPEAPNLGLVMETSGNECPDHHKFHTAQETCKFFQEQTTRPASTIRSSPLTGTVELTEYAMDVDRKKWRNEATAPVSGHMEPSEIRDRYPFGEEGMTEQVEYWSLADRTEDSSVFDDVPAVRQDKDLDMDELIYSEWLIYSKPLQTKQVSGSKVVGDIHLLKTAAQSTIQSKWRAYQKSKEPKSQTGTEIPVKCPGTEKAVRPKAEDSGTQARTRALEIGRTKESSLPSNDLNVATECYTSTAGALGDVTHVKEEAGHVSSILDGEANISDGTSQGAVREVVLVGDKYPSTSMRDGSVGRTVGSISEEGDGSGNTGVNLPHRHTAEIDAEGECCNNMECDDSPKDPSQGMESRKPDNRQHIIEQVPCNYQANDVTEPTGEVETAVEVETARPGQNPSNTYPCVMNIVTEDCSGGVVQSEKDDRQPQRSSERLPGGQGKTGAASTSDQEAQDANLLETQSRKPHGSGKKNIVHSPDMRKAEVDAGTSSSSRSKRHDLDKGLPRACIKLDDRSRRQHARYSSVSKEDRAYRRYSPCDTRRRFPDSSCRRGFKDRRSPPFVRSSRYGGGSSGLGGYSPRRRRFNGAARTPSPPQSSPDKKKSRAWELPPSVTHENVKQQAKVDKFSRGATCAGSVAPCTSFAVTAANSSLLPVLKQQLICPFTPLALIQAPRTLRRLYIGNVPASVSDGELLELLNAAMLSANITSIPGTKPCVNCSVHIEKSYAFAEFVTPEDATAALAFDGVTLHGTVLKIKRPKDYVQPVIFLGGISFSLSAQKEKVKEIVTSFGQLKSFHWEVDSSRFPPQVYAFFEYMDPQVTLKACAGLNGLPVANSIWTCVQATQDMSSKIEKPSYNVPLSAVGLLQAPTHILELHNLISEEEFLAMSETEVSEYVEDIKTECLRFGRIKAMHVIKPPTLNADTSNAESQEDADVPSTTQFVEHGTTTSKQEALYYIANKESKNNFHKNWGRIFVEYAREDSTLRAASCLHGRRYGSTKAVAGYFPAEGTFGGFINTVKVDFTAPT